MVPSGPPTPIGGAQSVSSSLLRSNSGLLGGPQPGSLPSQPPLSSLVSPRTQFNSNSLFGNISNVSSLLNQSFGNGPPGSRGGLGAPLANLQQRGGLGGGVAMVGSAEPDQLSFNSSSGPTQGQHFQNLSGNQLGSDRPQPQQLEAGQNLQQQFSVPHSQQQQQQLQGGPGNAGNMGPIKLEPQMGLTDQSGSTQQLQTLCSVGAVKMEPQQLQRSLGPVKMEPQHSDASMFQQQQQQQQQQQRQQYLQLKQSPQAVAAQMSLLQQQRMLQLQQQQQQQQLLKNLPQQRGQLQQQLHQQVLPVRPQVKQAMYEPGMCAQRLTHYMYRQRHRPEDNNIDFWRKFVAEFFAPNAKKRWCVSLYGSSRQTTGVLPQDAWHCEICNCKPGRGFGMYHRS